LTPARSKPRSATTRKPHSRHPREESPFHLPPVYVDECVSQTRLPESLRSHHGLTVFTRHDVFPNQATVDDVTWLARCAEEGWFVITKDKAIKRRQNEITLALSSGVRMFVIAAGDLTSGQQVFLIAAAMSGMRKYLKTKPGPFVVRITSDARLELIADQTGPRRRRRASR
jgi:PIN like domain